MHIGYIYPPLYIPLIYTFFWGGQYPALKNDHTTKIRYKEEIPIIIFSGLTLGQLLRIAR